MEYGGYVVLTSVSCPQHYKRNLVTCARHSVAMISNETMQLQFLMSYSEGNTEFTSKQISPGAMTFSRVRHGMR